MIFNGRNNVPYAYSRYGYTRGNGTTWHGGIDIVGLDDKTERMPSFNGKPITGTVVTSRIITDKSNRTWEWGHYVCVKLDANQTTDPVNYLYFCHNERNLVDVGAKVKTGDAIAIMGNSGNASMASPPIEHVHFEVRASATSTGQDPTAYCGFANAVGTYGEQIGSASYTATVLADGLRLRTLPKADAEAVQIDSLKHGAKYPLMQTKDGWAFLEIADNVGGWACIGDGNGEYLQISEV